MRRYTISVSDEAGDWIDMVVAASHLSRSEVIDLAILKMAKRQIGYAKRRGTPREKV